MAITPIVRSLRPRAIKAPLRKPHKTAAGTLEVAPLVVLDVETDVGVTGCSYVFVYTPVALSPVASLLSNLEELVVGNPLAPVTIAAMLQGRFRLLGNQGLTGIAIAAIDMALWDALAKNQRKVFDPPLRRRSQTIDGLRQPRPNEPE